MIYRVHLYENTRLKMNQKLEDLQKKKKKIDPSNSDLTIETQRQPLKQRDNKSSIY